MVNLNYFQFCFQMSFGVSFYRGGGGGSKGSFFRGIFVPEPPRVCVPGQNYVLLDEKQSTDETR